MYIQLLKSDTSSCTSYKFLLRTLAIYFSISYLVVGLLKRSLHPPPLFIDLQTTIHGRIKHKIIQNDSKTPVIRSVLLSLPK